MSEENRPLTELRLNTPRAAAVAGILFAALLITAYVLIRVSIPPDPADGGAWLEEQAQTVALALSLVSIAGIAFLWFIGVLRDRMGQLEDRFFSSVFLGSGLLYLAMTFVRPESVGNPALSGLGTDREYPHTGFEPAQAGRGRIGHPGHDVRRKRTM